MANRRRNALLVLAPALLVIAGCGEDDDGLVFGVDPAVACAAMAAAPPPGEPNPDPAHVGWTDVTADVGIGLIYSQTASWGDVDGDGRVDLLVSGSLGFESAHLRGSVRDALYGGCGGHFTRVWESRRVWNRAGTASMITDLDRDGRPDLVVAHRNDLFVHYQRAPMAFETVQIWGLPGDPRDGKSKITGLLPLDADGDGRLDLYVSRLQDGAVNALLLSRGDGTFEDVIDRHPALSEAGRGPTYATALFPRVEPALPPVLYVGNDTIADRLLTVHTGGFQAWVPSHPVFTTMGVDQMYLDDDGSLIVATSQTETLPLWSIRGEGALEDVSARLARPSKHNTWGVLFGDFDNDGHEDLVYAAGADPHEPECVSNAWDCDSRLLFFAGAAPDAPDRPPRFVDGSAHAGPLFDGSTLANYYSLSSADFDGDGCPDLAATPLDLDTEKLFDTPLKILRNRCGYPGHWIGLRMTDDPGGLVTLRLRHPDGRPLRRYRAIKGASSVASRGDLSVLHVGLGSIAKVERLEVRCSCGRTRSVPGSALVIDRINDLRDACSVCWSGPLLE